MVVVKKTHSLTTV